jgi:hypothetical protein
MKRLLCIGIMLCWIHPLSAQYWSKQFDNASGAGDAIRFVDATESEVVTLSKSYGYATGTGGVVFRRLDRKDGRVVAEAKFTQEDSLFYIGGVIRINPNRYALIYSTNSWGGTPGAYNTLHYVDSNGNTIAKFRGEHVQYSLSLRSVSKINSCLAMVSYSFPPWATANSHIELFGLDGQTKIAQTIDSFSTRYFQDVLSIEDTFVVLQGSGSGIRIIQFDTLGQELRRSNITGHETFNGTDLHLTKDSTKYLVSGFIGGFNTNPQAIMVLDRGLHKLDFETWDIGTGATARTVLENRFGEYLLVGHARYEGVFGNRDNAFVMRIDPVDFSQKSLHFYTPSGDQSDGKIQIILTADVQDSILYIAGHGGINDTTGSEDDWILALTDLGTCDTMDCFPWLVSGLESVPAEWMEHWTVGTGAEAWHVQLGQPALWREGSRLVLYDAAGQRLREVPVYGPEATVPYGTLPAGIYILEWQREQQKMYRRVLRP